MSNKTTITLGAFQFDDLNQNIVVPFSIENSILGNQPGITQNIPYAAFAAQSGNQSWLSTMSYSEIKSTIKNYVLTGVGIIEIV